MADTQRDESLDVAATLAHPHHILLRDTDMYYNNFLVRHLFVVFVCSVGVCVCVCCPSFFFPAHRCCISFLQKFWLKVGISEGPYHGHGEIVRSYILDGRSHSCMMWWCNKQLTTWPRTHNPISHGLHQCVASMCTNDTRSNASVFCMYT